MTTRQPIIPHKLLTQLRQLLHKYPELSGMENKTAKRISGFLRSQKPARIIDHIGGFGVAAIYQYNTPGPAILIRCELDALPIEEENTFRHRSQRANVSHKCGHDGHMAIVAGLAAVLNKSRNGKGKVILLFQPAEEDGRGAANILSDKKFSEIKPDYVFALHNLPGYAKNKIVCRSGSFTAAVRSIIITLEGKTAHAGEPEKGINPALAVAEILQAAAKLEKPKGKKDFSQITPIQVEMGKEAYGTSAGDGVVKLTLRTFDNKLLEKLSADMEKQAKQIAKKYHLKCTIGWTQFFSANQNDKMMAALVKKAAHTNQLAYEEKKEPFRWGEDFGLFTEKFKGAMFGVGAGERTPALHNPDYDFPDEIIPTGVKMFKSIIDELQQ